MTKQSTFIWCIDAGHGGMKNGVYTTAPAKMWKFPDGFTIYEGVINRAIAKLVWLQLAVLDIDFKLVYDESEDDSLDVRCNRVNAIAAKEDRACILVDLHSNSGGGVGNEIFVYNKASERSRKVANIFCETYINYFPSVKLRKGNNGTLYKEANFQMLRETNCASILIENGFFDNRMEAEYLRSQEGQQEIANCIVQCIQNVEQLKPVYERQTI